MNGNFNGDYENVKLNKKGNCRENRAMNIILIGAPGSGKGTQASLISEEFCLCKFSSGDIFREAIRNKTELGLEAKKIMDKGELLSDELAIQMLDIPGFMKKPECKYGVVFDGFPRTTGNIEYLEYIFKRDEHKIDCVIELDIDDEKLIERIEGRRIHPSSGRVYHIVHNKPKNHNLDDITGDTLMHRIDDQRETIINRLDLYNNTTKPLINYYREKLNDKIFRINSGNKIEEVFIETKNIIMKL